MNNNEAMQALIIELSGQANMLVIPRVYIDLMGSIEGGLLLSQMIYWSDRSKRDDGYFFKSYDEWNQETSLSKHKVAGLVNKMKDAGFLETQVMKAYGSPTVHYRISFSDFRKWLVKEFNYGKLKGLTMESEKPSLSITETTTEINKTEINRHIKTDFPISDIQESEKDTETETAEAEALPKGAVDDADDPFAIVEMDEAQKLFDDFIAHLRGMMTRDAFIKVSTGIHLVIKDENYTILFTEEAGAWVRKFETKITAAAAMTGVGYAIESKVPE